MELQGKEVPRDFLSLYSPGSSFQLQDPRSSSQGTPQLVPNITQNFLQPLEQKEKCEEGMVEDGGIRFPLERSVELGLSSNVGGCGVGRVGKAVAKRESSTVRLGIPIEVEVKPEPDYGSWSTTTSYGSYAGGVSHALWDNKETAFRGQGPFVFAAASSSCLPEAIPKDLTTKVEEKVRSANQTPNTPRSKHSATEQRRRSKINNRFQILREIIPHRDQKRDKASFLLEVIEYIRFLQEKIEKFEASHTTWNQDNAKLIPWKSCQATTNGLSILSQVTRRDSAPPVNMFSKKSEAVRNSVGVPPQSSMQCSPAIGMVCGNSSKTMETASNNLLQPRLFTIGSETIISQSQQRLIRNPVDMVFQDRSPWLRSCNHNEEEELAVDDGTISISTAYTHKTLHALSQALQSTGVDLTQAGISVQINLGNRAINRRSIATASTVKESRDPASINQATCGYSRSEKFNIELQSQAPKRHKAENC